MSNSDSLFDQLFKADGRYVLPPPPQTTPNNESRPQSLGARRTQSFSDLPVTHSSHPDESAVPHPRGRSHSRPRASPSIRRPGIHSEPDSLGRVSFLGADSPATPLVAEGPSGQPGSLYSSTAHHAIVGPGAASEFAFGSNVPHPTNLLSALPDTFVASSARRSSTKRRASPSPDEDNFGMVHGHKSQRLDAPRPRVELMNPVPPTSGSQLQSQRSRAGSLSPRRAFSGHVAPYGGVPSTWSIREGIEHGGRMDFLNQGDSGGTSMASDVSHQSHVPASGRPLSPQFSPTVPYRRQPGPLRAHAGDATPPEFWEGASTGPSTSSFHFYREDNRPSPPPPMHSPDAPMSHTFHSRASTEQGPSNAPTASHAGASEPTLGEGEDAIGVAILKAKRRRKKTPAQSSVLSEAYAKNRFPTADEQTDLAKRLGLTFRQVQVWFQNKRQTSRRQGNMPAD